MRKLIPAIVIIIVGCSLFLIPGVFSQASLATTGQASVDTEETEAVREKSLDVVAETAHPVGDATKEGEAATDVSALSSTETTDAPETPDYETVFPGTTVQRLAFTIAAADWSFMIAEVSGTEREVSPGGMPGDSRAPMQRPQADSRPPLETAPPAAPGQLPGAAAAPSVPGAMGAQTADTSSTYVPCTVEFGNQIWENVGIRFKGHSTLSSTVRSGSLKYPFHLDFDEFEDVIPAVLNQRFFGFDDLSLGNMSIDRSYVRQYVAAEILRSFGVPTPEVAFYQVVLDIGNGEQFLGLYAMTETPDDAFLDEYFGSSSGNLYKPQGGSASWASFDEASFEKKSNQEEADWSDLKAVFEALHASRDDAAAWRADLEAVFDVDGFLRWLAITRLTGNWDSYGQMPQNYYLYTSPDGIVHWIPWDLNESFTSRMGSSSTSIDLSTTGDNWPLISFVISDPVYEAAYDAYIQEALETVFSSEAVEPLIRETFDAIAPFLVDESGNLSPYSFSGTVDDSRAAMEAVIAFAATQNAQARNYIMDHEVEREGVVIAEIHYNPSPDQGSDADYEFVELCNAGEEPEDLSGWQFDDGIVCTIPSGTVLDPGEVLVIAANPASYEHLDCQVLGWESGKLSNGGETLRLIDEEGGWIDCVSYNDEGVWSDVCDGNGPSLELVAMELPNHIPANWEASQTIGGTPGI